MIPLEPTAMGCFAALLVAVIVEAFAIAELQRRGQAMESEITRLRKIIVRHHLGEEP